MKRKVTQLSLLSISILSSLYAGNLAIENPNVVSGQVSFDGLQSNQATITQHTNKAIVDYSRFDVMAGGAVNFDQPSAQAAILNRIQSADPSQLNGAITGNGQIYFVNPAGVTFGPNSIIRADTFMAVAGQIENGDFLAGQLQFDLQGTVSNYGLIETLNDVALLGNRVINAGDIVSKSGVSILSAGDEVLLRENGSSLAVQLTTRVSVEQVGAAIENSGTVEGEEVMFSAGDAYSLALLQSGTVRAAKSAKLYAENGRIEVSGQVVAQSEATAGLIEVGGTDRGGSGAPIASEVIITETAVLDASAISAGNGGHVVVYSSGTTEMFGGLYAKGLGGGQGGFAEISGKQLLLSDDIWDIQLGNGGHLLFDPIDYTIDFTAAANIVALLNAGMSHTINTIGTGGNGDIFVNADIAVTDAANQATLTLDADRDIQFGSGISITSNQSLLSTTDIFVLDAGRDILVDGAIVASSVSNLGTIRLSAGHDITVNVGSGIVSVGSNLVFTAQNDVIIFGQVGGSSGLSEINAVAGAIAFGGSAFFEIRNAAEVKLTAQQFINNSGSSVISQQGSGFWQIVLPHLNGETVDTNPHTYGGLLSSNYAVYDSSGTMTISKNEYHFAQVPVLGITVTDDFKTYGDALADANYQGYVVDPNGPNTLISAADYGGIFLQDSAASSINVDAIVLDSPGAPVIEDAGLYVLDATGFASYNGYDFDVTPGEFTVKKRALTVTADRRTRIYGDELDLGTSLFTYEDTHEGVGDVELPNDDVLTTVTLGSLTDAATTTTDNVGVYSDEVTVDSLVATADFNPDNYDLTPVAADLEVLVRDITVTALEQNKYFGNVEGFGGTVDSLNGTFFEVTDLDSDDSLPNGEAIILTTMDYAFGVDLGKSTITGVSTTFNAINITSVTGANDFDVDNYNINFVNGDYRIDARPITVTALEQSKQYGVDATLLNTEFSVLDDLTGGGALPNGELINSVAVASTGSYDSSTTQGVGTYTDDLDISALDATSNGFIEGNYTITYEKGDYTIDPREVTLTATQQSKLYGDTLTLDGDLFTITDLDADAVLPNGELIDSVSLQSLTGVDISTTADAQVYVDEIRINGQSGSAGFDQNNYNFTYVDGNLLVSPRPITLTALAQEKTYGEGVTLTNSQAFALEDVSLGAFLPNGELIDSVNLLSAADNGSTVSAAGFYADDLSIDSLNTSNGFDISNYAPIYVTGDFQVNLRSITISLLDQVKPYGEPYAFDSEAFTLFDPLSGTPDLPNGEQVVGVTFQTPTLNPITAAPGVYEALLQAQDAVGDNGFNAANYSITFSPADLTVFYINDIAPPVVPGEAYLDQQEFAYAGNPITTLFNPIPPISANGLSSLVERPEWTSMSPEQQAWVFAQVGQMQGGTQLSEELVEYLIAEAKAH